MSVNIAEIKQPEHLRRLKCRFIFTDALLKVLFSFFSRVNWFSRLFFSFATSLIETISDGVYHGISVMLAEKALHMYTAETTGNKTQEKCLHEIRTMQMNFMIL